MNIEKDYKNVTKNNLSCMDVYGIRKPTVGSLKCIVDE